MSRSGKLELEGVPRGGRPSKASKRTAPTTIDEESEQYSSDETNEYEIPKRSRRTRKVNQAIVKQIHAQYYNPDPLVRLIGDANESVLQVDNYKVTALIDSGAQISTITESFVKLLKLQTRSLRKLLKIEGTGGGRVPYKGYLEVTLKVPEVAKFREWFLFLVIADSEYGNRVPVQLGTLHIDMLLNSATSAELASLGKTWERGQVGRVIANRQAQLEGFDLNSVKGVVRLTQPLTVKPGEGCRI